MVNEIRPGSKESSSQKKLNFPTHIEEFTARFLHNYCSTDQRINEREFGHNLSDIVYRLVRDERVKTTWELSKKYYAECPSRGQIELILAVLGSLPGSSGPYATKSNAEAWKKKFIKKVGELAELWKDRPRNFTHRGQFFSNAIFNRLPGRHRKVLADNDETLRELSKIFDTGASFPIYAKAILQAKYQSRGHGVQVEGRGKKVYFVRHFSSLLKGITGEWKRASVSTITSVVFDCSYDETNVRDAMKDWDIVTEPSFHKYSNGTWHDIVDNLIE